MILLDANILIYAHVASFPQHERARTWLDGQLNSNGAVGFPWYFLPSYNGQGGGIIQPKGSEEWRVTSDERRNNKRSDEYWR